MPRKQKKYHFMYKTTNLITHKYYVGMHSTHNLNDGYLGSGKRLWYSLNKYGRENHMIERLEFFETREDLRKREIEIVNEDLLKDVLCINLKMGGLGGFSLEQQRINATHANKKMNWLRENDIVWAKKIAENISKGNKETYNNGRIPNPPNWTGRKHKEKTKEKMKKTFQSIQHQHGNKNSQYGTCWITNGKEDKKIHKNDLIPNGWKLGRKCARSSNERISDYGSEDLRV
jgi:hypothetical protein